MAEELKERMNKRLKSAHHPERGYCVAKVNVQAGQHNWMMIGDTVLSLTYDDVVEVYLNGKSIKTITKLTEFPPVIVEAKYVGYAQSGGAMYIKSDHVEWAESELGAININGRVVKQSKFMSEYLRNQRNTRAANMHYSQATL